METGGMKGRRKRARARRVARYTLQRVWGGNDSLGIRNDRTAFASLFCRQGDL